MNTTHRVLVVNRPDNSLGGHPPSPLSSSEFQFRDVAIWMGSLYNCGEGEASILVQNNRTTLERFVYLPKAHKGGRMVRPNYYRSVTTLGYWEDCGTPTNVKWIVPQLKTLYVFSFPHRVDTMLNHWKVADESQGDAVVDPHAIRSFVRLPERTAEECPRLSEIFCAVVQGSAAPNEWRVVRRLKPPKPLDWTKLRLLHLAMRCETETCPLGNLPEAVMHKIVSCVHRPRWKVEESNAE